MGETKNSIGKMLKKKKEYVENPLHTGKIQSFAQKKKKIEMRKEGKNKEQQKCISYKNKSNSRRKEKINPQFLYNIIFFHNITLKEVQLTNLLLYHYLYPIRKLYTFPSFYHNRVVESSAPSISTNIDFTLAVLFILFVTY